MKSYINQVLKMAKKLIRTGFNIIEEYGVRRSKVITIEHSRLQITKYEIKTMLLDIRTNNFKSASGAFAVSILFYSISNQELR